MIAGRLAGVLQNIVVFLVVISSVVPHGNPKRTVA